VSIRHPEQQPRPQGMNSIGECRCRMDATTNAETPHAVASATGCGTQDTRTPLTGVREHVSPAHEFPDDGDARHDDQGQSPISEEHGCQHILGIAHPDLSPNDAWNRDEHDALEGTRLCHPRLPPPRLLLTRQPSRCLTAVTDSHTTIRLTAAVASAATLGSPGTVYSARREATTELHVRGVQGTRSSVRSSAR
jgi:hypothetical protein